MATRIESGDGDAALAVALGWFSIGLGLAQVTAPGAVARFIGIDDDERNRTLMRVFGAREFASGVGILTQPRPAGWLWARVAGDVMDLAVLGLALRSEESERSRVAGATAAVLGALALDVLGAKRAGDRREAATTPARAA